MLTVRLGASNVYLLPAGDSYAAIDAGPDYEGAWASAVEQLRTAGLSPADVGPVLVTHGHPDHCALASAWQGAGAEVWIGGGDAAKMLTGGREPVMARSWALDFLAAGGLPTELVESARGPAALRTAASRATRMGRGHVGDGRLTNLRSIAPDHGEWPGPLRPTPATANRHYPEDGTLAFGPLRLQPIRCPGHTPASTVFLNDATGDLYTGDHVLERIAPTPGIHFDENGERLRSLPQYLRSLAAVRSLPVSQVLPGHGEPFTDLAGAVDRTTGTFNQRASRLLRRLREGPARPWELALRLYPHLRPSAAWIVMAEVVGLLDLLEERDTARRISDEPIVFEVRR